RCAISKLVLSSRFPLISAHYSSFSSFIALKGLKIRLIINQTGKAITIAKEVFPRLVISSITSTTIDDKSKKIGIILRVKNCALSNIGERVSLFVMAQQRAILFLNFHVPYSWHDSRNESMHTLEG
ncbi:MAG: hypothetical protein KAI61_06380, partial [Alphaproteobacteria bacterium]|nr:hypothetical protein [Alphaproteobacteria bacterium]